MHIHEEDVDAGGQFDSHACLDRPGIELARCLRDAGSRAEGFVRLEKKDDAFALGVQLHVLGRTVGVQPMGAAQRRVGVTWWSQIVATPFMQILAAALLLCATLAAVWPEKNASQPGRNA
jgi:hypothetical protein